MLLQDAPDGAWPVDDAARRRDAHQRGRAGGPRALEVRETRTRSRRSSTSTRARRAQLRVRGDAQRTARTSRPARRSPTPPTRGLPARAAPTAPGTYIAEGSIDGETWQPIADPITDLGDPETMQVRPEGLRRHGADNRSAVRLTSASTARTASRRRRRRRSARRGRTASSAGTRRRRRSR